MLQRIKITSQDNQLFAPCWELYTTAFPEVERREMWYHLETMQKSDFAFEAILDDDQFIGIIGWWRLGGVRFIEHLATTPEVRGKGYGVAILESFLGEASEGIILEVEHPTTALSSRRIGFYERSGFSLNSYDYSHPSYDVESPNYVELLLMSYPSPLSEEKYETFKEECFREVHFGHKKSSLANR